MKDNWLIFNNEIFLSEAIAQKILNIAKKSIFEKGCFSIVLTGGRSALGLYKILSVADSNWNKWHVYISDERSMPKDHEDRNDRVINKIWLDDSPIPEENIHFIQAELGLVNAQKEYEKELDKVDKFDVVLISIGEDGHISSLFPGHKYSENKNVVIERNSPKAPKERLSMSYRRLDNTINVFKIIIGKQKRSIVKRFIEGEKLPSDYVNGEVEFFFMHANSMPNTNTNTNTNNESINNYSSIWK